MKERFSYIHCQRIPLGVRNILPSNPQAKAFGLAKYFPRPREYVGNSLGNIVLPGDHFR